MAPLLLALAVLGGVHAHASAAHPVAKVITLLKDMVSQLEKEAKADEDMYETMGCWCETNDKEKTKAISEAESRIESLNSAIEEYTGKSGRLNEEIGAEQGAREEPGRPGH